MWKSKSSLLACRSRRKYSMEISRDSAQDQFGIKVTYWCKEWSGGKSLHQRLNQASVDQYDRLIILCPGMEFWNIYFYAPDRMIGAYCFCPVCLSVCLSVFCLSVLNFNIEPLEVETWHAYSTNDALSNDAKVNDIVTLTFTFALK